MGLETKARAAYGEERRVSFNREKRGVGERSMAAAFTTETTYLGWREVAQVREGFTLEIPLPRDGHGHGG